MPLFKIATWNVNSLRVRLPYVQAWLAEVQPDVLVLQETKLLDEHFPFAALEERGYVAIASGQKTYNGVAILSRKKIMNVIMGFPAFEDAQRRVLCATVENICIVNLYIPNGQSIDSDKYQYKLEWLNQLNLFLQEELKKNPRIIVLGDFNIAPEEIDVHDPALWEGQVLFSQPERQAFRDLLSLGFSDCFRQHTPSEKSYSWWDYRMNAFKRNMGMRIDHILASKELINSCTRCYIDKSPRAGERPSDHVPVVLELEIE
jgi:exodeoxyribonuclease-3